MMWIQTAHPSTPNPSHPLQAPPPTHTHTSRASQSSQCKHTKWGIKEKRRKSERVESKKRKCRISRGSVQCQGWHAVSQTGLGTARGQLQRLLASYGLRPLVAPVSSSAPGRGDCPASPDPTTNYFQSSNDLSPSSTGADGPTAPPGCCWVAGFSPAPGGQGLSPCHMLRAAKSHLATLQPWVEGWMVPVYLFSSIDWKEPTPSEGALSSLHSQLSCSWSFSGQCFLDYRYVKNL